MELSTPGHFWLFQMVSLVFAEPALTWVQAWFLAFSLYISFNVHRNPFLPPFFFLHEETDLPAENQTPAGSVVRHMFQSLSTPQLFRLNPGTKWNLTSSRWGSRVTSGVNFDRKHESKGEVTWPLEDTPVWRRVIAEWSSAWENWVIQSESHSVPSSGVCQRDECVYCSFEESC